MFARTDYAVASAPGGRRTHWMTASQFGLDVARGALTMSKMVAVLVVVAAAVVVVAVALHGGAREHATKMLPTSVLAWASERLQERNAPPAMASQALALDAAAKAESKRVVDEVQQRRVTQYLARRYRVAEEAMRALVAVAFESGEEAGVDPLLVLAVMAVESSMNPFAESSVGAQGLMQVLTRVHTEKFESHGGSLAALDPVANIKVGTLILQDLIQRGGSVERGLQLYVGAGNLDNDGGYGRRVLAEHGRLKLAASGKVDMALLSSARPDGKVELKSVGATLPVQAPQKNNETPTTAEKTDEAA